MSEKVAHLTVNGSWTQFVDVLKNRQPFTTRGALWGTPVTCTPFPGRLPADWRNLLETGCDYVVFSYGTPIAWHRPADDIWITPDEKYSVTTSKHQGRIFTAISQLQSAAA